MEDGDWVELVLSSDVMGEVDGLNEEKWVDYRQIGV